MPVPVRHDGGLVNSGCGAGIAHVEAIGSAVDIKNVLLAAAAKAFGDDPRARDLGGRRVDPRAEGEFKVGGEVQ